MAFEPERRVCSLSLMPTYRCTATCTHCGTLSSPHEKTHLEAEYLFGAIDQAAELRYHNVVFTGGEATLAGDLLFELLSHATRLELKTRVVTNAWWARDEERAAAWIQRFRNAGLNEINFSTGPEHSRFVPVERILLAAEVATKAELPVSIMVEVTRARDTARAAIEASLRYQRLVAEGRVIHILESPWMPLDPSTVGDYEDGLTADRSNVSARSGCDSVLQTTTVGADGRIGACCGIGLRLIPELHVGDIRDQPLEDADREAEQDFLKHWIRTEGPERILSWAATHDSSIEWEGMYAHRCQACLRLYQDPAVRKVVRHHYEEKVPDVMMGEWLRTARP